MEGLRFSALPDPPTYSKHELQADELVRIVFSPHPASSL